MKKLICKLMGHRWAPTGWAVYKCERCEQRAPATMTEPGIYGPPA